MPVLQNKKNKEKTFILLEKGQVSKVVTRLGVDKVKPKGWFWGFGD